MIIHMIFRKQSDSEKLHKIISTHPHPYVGEGNNNPCQCSCLGNSTDREAWQATVHGVTESRTWLSNQVALCHPMDYTVHEILQARILEWVAFSFSRWSSQPRDPAMVSYTAGRFFFTNWANREAHRYIYIFLWGKNPIMGVLLSWPNLYCPDLHLQILSP